MFLPILAKIAAEAMLSFYPMMIKLIHIPMETQMWTRFFTYGLISSLFVDWDFIYNSILTYDGISLVLVSLLHVYTSYRGFELLESGVSYSMFYIYPILILLFSGGKYSPIFYLWCLIALIGVYLLSSSTTEKDKRQKKQNKQKEGLEIVASQTTTTEWTHLLGIIMIGLAAITEAWIYFIVRNIKTNNNWNHVFLSYFMGGVLLTIYQGTIYFTQHQIGLPTTDNTTMKPLVLASLALNAMIGLFGYLLRFYATSRLSPQIYAPLSYVGVVMAYVYGIFLDQDVLNWKKVVGTLCILVPNLMLLKMKK